MRIVVTSCHVARGKPRRPCVFRSDIGNCHIMSKAGVSGTPEGKGEGGSGSARTRAGVTGPGPKHQSRRCGKHVLARTQGTSLIPVEAGTDTQYRVLSSWFWSCCRGNVDRRLACPEFAVIMDFFICLYQNLVIAHTV